MLEQTPLLHQIAVGENLPELEIEVTTTLVILGALASRDWQPQHHDKDFAQNRSGTCDIFINTQHNAALIEKFVTDWTGPEGRLGKIKFKMLSSVFPGDRLKFTGAILKIHETQNDICWLDISTTMSVGKEPRTQGMVRIAVPATATANPWSVGADQWNPDFEPMTDKA